MAADLDIDTKVARLLLLARQKFGVRAKSLERAMRKIGRRVPARLHRQAKVISTAQRLSVHPKLRMQVDAAAVTLAFEKIERHLAAIDVRARRMDRLLDVLGSVSFNLIALTALLMIFLRWRGLV